MFLCNRNKRAGDGGYLDAAHRAGGLALRRFGFRVRPSCNDPRSMRVILVAWWACCVGVAWWAVRDHVPPLMWVVVAAATMFVYLVWRCSPYHGGVRLAVYLSALVANQATAATAGFWPLLPML